MTPILEFAIKCFADNFQFIAVFLKYDPLTFLSMKKADGFFVFLDEQTGCNTQETKSGLFFNEKKEIWDMCIKSVIFAF